MWELGLDFTVSPGKTGFRGAEEHYRLKGKERFKIFGVLLDGNEPADEGAPVYRDGKKVGVVTCAMYSPLAKKSMAIARLDVDCAIVGTPLEIRNENGPIKATAQPLPFDDPKKPSARQRAEARLEETGTSGQADDQEPPGLWNIVTAGRQVISCSGRRRGVRDPGPGEGHTRGFFAKAHIMFIPRIRRQTMSRR